MQLKSILFLTLFMVSIIGPASIRLFAEDTTTLIIVISEEEQQEDLKVDVKGKKMQNVASEILENNPFKLDTNNLNSSEKNTFWNSIHSDTFYPPPEIV